MGSFYILTTVMRYRLATTRCFIKPTRVLCPPSDQSLPLSFLFAHSSPLALEDDGKQVAFAVSDDLGGPVYEDGELPPLKDTEGWIDPRLNGGRFLDVSLDLIYLAIAFTLSLVVVYHQEARRTSQYHYFESIRPVHPGRVWLA